MSQTDHEKLFDDYLSDCMSADGMKELKLLLRDDRNARAEFARYVNETSLMVSVGGLISERNALRMKPHIGTGDTVITIQKIIQDARKKERRSNAGAWWWALAASFAIVVGGLWFWNGKDKSGTLPVSIASLADKHGNVTLERNGDLFNIAKGAPLYAGDGIRTENGSRAVVKYPDSTRLEVAANSTITLQPAISRQGTGDRGQKADDRGPGSEVGGQKAEVRGQRSVVSGQQSEGRGQRSEVGGQMEERGQASAPRSTAYNLKPITYNLNSSKIVQIAGGTLFANVAKQPEGLPMVFQT
ncbi:MAG: hypothetical protein WAX69_06605, partial [Victivallales bacterium]